MRIGIDATCWASPRGYGRFTRELVPALVALVPHHTFVCFLDQHAAASFDLRAPNVETRVVPQRESPTIAASAAGYRSPRDMLGMTWAVARGSLDVFFSPSVYTFFPVPPGLSTVVTIHDAIVERFPALTMPGWRARVFWALKVRLALAQARLVLTVSEFAADEIVSFHGIDRDRVRIALEAPALVYTLSADPADVARAAAAHGLSEGVPWFVYVGGFNPHKHVDVLVRAHARVARERSERAPHLLLVGPLDRDVFHNDHQRIRTVIEDEGTERIVHWLGYLPDADLRLLHAGALGLVLPSACEGFGLPAVEAAACGTPVVATVESPLPDLLAGGGLFVEPGDTAALADALRSLADSRTLRRDLGARAQERTRALTWPRAARAVLDVLEEVA